MDDKLTYWILKEKAINHLNHILAISKDRDDLFFRLSGFYGGLSEVLRENKLIK